MIIRLSSFLYSLISPFRNSQIVSLWATGTLFMIFSILEVKVLKTWAVLTCSWYTIHSIFDSLLLNIKETRTRISTRILFSMFSGPKNWGKNNLVLTWVRYYNREHVYWVSRWLKKKPWPKPLTWIGIDGRTIERTDAQTKNIMPTRNLK